MKTSQKLGLAAVVVFVVSHFLPAYGTGAGFSCFQACWNMLLGREGTLFNGAWFYYSGFAVSNLFFPALAGALLMTQKSRRVRAAVAVAFFLHVLSWVMLHLRSPELAEIKIGYYVWLAAYGLLAAAHVWKEPQAALASNPPAPSVV